jgi:hypothetical protein
LAILEPVLPTRVSLSWKASGATRTEITTPKAQRLSREREDVSGQQHEEESQIDADLVNVLVLRVITI